MKSENQLDNGLTQAQVDEQIANGLINVTSEKTSRSTWDIVRTNVFTRFNALLSLLFIIILIVGEPIDGLFFIAVIVNSGIGIIQELRAKHTLDRLSILNAPKVTVKRDGKERVIPTEEVVQDDLVKVTIGDQIPTDGYITETEGVEVDESLLTGEADAVVKRNGDTVLSGAFVVAGTCWYRATAVGDNAYAHKLTAQVKRFTKMRSELLEGTNKLLGYISIIILFVAPLLVWGQLTRTHVSFQEAMVRSIAATVGMIPEGLVVLTSFAFVLAALALARRNVLVQELPAVEGLARVDVICLDKTGTLTEGKIVFEEFKLQPDADEATVRAVLATFADKADSPTLEAIGDAFSKGALKPKSRVAFNSKRKWSALTVGDTSWIMGAPEIIFGSNEKALQKTVEAYAKNGRRVMVLASSPGTITEKTLPAHIRPEALIILKEKIRDDAAETLAYFREQGVELKVISGDNPVTVAAIAREVGIDCSEPFDARNLPTDIKEIAKIIETHNVFGRVLPEQKQLFVKALQSNGHVVAMTGDGVNDALALKDADIGIAMGNGAPATRAIAKIVLLDNKFSHMPHVLGEGRRVIANIERVANLFVVKNVYNLTFAILVTAMALSYPFLPRHLSLISWLTIGIPSFFLALGPNKQRYVPGFLKRVLTFSIPVGLIVAVSALYTYSSVLAHDHVLRTASSAAVISVVTIGFWVLFCLARPLRFWKVALIGSMISLFILAISWPWLADILQFQSVWPYNLQGLLVGMVGAVFVELIWRRQKRI